MFTWICPQCGREVPPSYTECPTCAERQKQAAAPPPPPPPRPEPVAPPPAYAPSQQPYAPPPPYAQPQYAAPQPQQPVYTIGEQKKGMPSWLVALLTLAVLGGGFAGLYKLLSKSDNGRPVAAGPKLEQPGPAGGAHPYLKFVEIVGVRILEDERKRPAVRYVVVNHSPAELGGVELRLTFLASSDKGDADSFAEITTKVGTLAPYGSKDLEAPLATKLKIYELPDWQFVKVNVEITAPR